MNGLRRSNCPTPPRRPFISDNGHLVGHYPLPMEHPLGGQNNPFLRYPLAWDQLEKHTPLWLPVVSDLTGYRSDWLPLCWASVSRFVTNSQKYTTYYQRFSSRTVLWQICFCEWELHSSLFFFLQSTSATLYSTQLCTLWQSLSRWKSDTVTQSDCSCVGIGPLVEMSNCLFCSFPEKHSSLREFFVSAVAVSGSGGCVTVAANADSGV